MAVTVQLSEKSMFLETPVYEDSDGTLTFGMRAQVFFPDASDFIIAVDQSSEGRLDLIAYNYLGDAKLWWVIAEINNIVDPASYPLIGTSLRIPSKSRVQEKIQ